MSDIQGSINFPNILKPYIILGARRVTCSEFHKRFVYSVR